MQLLFTRRGLGLRLVHASVIVAIAVFAFFHAAPSRSASGTGSGTLIAYEPFAGTAGPLDGSNGGFGWAGPWQVQNSVVTVPGYNIASTTPLTVSGITQSGNYAVGGINYQMSGRTFDTTSTGPFSPYLTAGLIGQSGQSLYVGMLMRKDMNTDDEMSLTLHPGGNPAWYVAAPGVSVGHFGSASNVNGTRYWSLRLNGAVIPSNTPVVVGQAAFLLLRLDFAATNTLSLYVNPPAGSLPASPNATTTTTSSVAFQSLAWYPGSGAGQSSLDELRVAASYSAIISATAPPPAAPTGLTATPGDKFVNLAWNAVSGATAYKVYQGINGSTHLEATVATNSLSDTGLINGSIYTYYVETVSPSGQSVPSGSVTAVPRGAAPVAHPGLGTNLSALADYGRELPFVDIFKTARPWISQLQGAPWGQGPALDLDANGWIKSLQSGQYAETLLLDNALDDQPNYPAGQYVVLYDGQGTIAFDQNSASIVSQTSGRMVVTIPSGQNGVFLMVTATNAANPLRNIRFLMPGAESTYKTQPFNPIFLQKLQGYKVLRFMEWALINGSNQQNWTDRPLTTDYTYLWRGVPVETMIQLASATKLTPWFNIPAKATDDYARQFATLVKKSLPSTLNFYLEYSNETWNGGFSQNAYVKAQGLALGFSTDPTVAGADFTGWRASRIFSLFQSVFGGASRIIRVIAAQAGNSWISDITLGYQNAFVNADALAIAPYFNCDDTPTGGFGTLGDPATATQVATMTTDQVIDIELQHINGCAMQQMTSNSAVARKYGLRMVAYEGGQSLVGYGGTENNSTVTSLFKAANRSPRMTALYAQYLQNWITAGGDMFVHFTDVTSFTKYGNFGALEYQDQDPNTAPKYQALMTFAAQHP